MSSPQSPMDGVEFQLRSHGGRPESSQFPLALDKRINQGDHIRTAKDELITDLRTLEEHYASPQAGVHEVGECTRCNAKKADIISAFRKYYLSTDPNAWYHDFPQYKDEMGRLFQHINEPKDSLDNIHYVFQSALREHLKNDLCAPQPRDTAEIYNMKNTTAQIFEHGRPTKDILNNYLEESIKKAPSNDAIQFLTTLQYSRTAQERANIYISYYCTPVWNENAQQKNFRLKYTRMFEALVPHDEVVAAMKKEAEDSHGSKVNGLQRQLSELQMAQSAHLRSKSRKAEKNQRLRDQEPAPSPTLVDCNFPGCPVELDLTEENIECALCEWMAAKGYAAEKRRTYYCSPEHAEEDFEDHERREHQCCMGEKCIYYPRAGPSEETEAPGICQQCARRFGNEGREEQTPLFYFFFCSNSCYKVNLASHRQSMHGSASGEYEILEPFRPARDMDLVS